MKTPTHDRGEQCLILAHPNQAKTLPPDPELENSNRAKSAAAVLKSYQQRTPVDLEDALSDLLADLVHWCDRVGQDFDMELLRARRHYAEETATSCVSAVPKPEEF